VLHCCAAGKLKSPIQYLLFVNDLGRPGTRHHAKNAIRIHQAGGVELNFRQIGGFIRRGVIHRRRAIQRVAGLGRKFVDVEIVKIDVADGAIQRVVAANRVFLPVGFLLA